MDIELAIPPPYRSGDGAIADRDVYRLSTIFDDVAIVAKWRLGADTLILGDISALANDLRPATLRSDFCDLGLRLIQSDIGISANLQGIKDWHVPFLSDNITLSDISFFSTLVVCSSLQLLRSGNPVDDDKALSLLANAASIHEYLCTETLTALSELQTVKASQLLTFILAELRYRRSRSGTDELERRWNFMDLFPSKEKSAIVPFLDSLVRQQPTLAIQLARMCTRRFLERLFLVMTSVRDVLETRLEICVWLSKHDEFHDEDYLEEQNALARELSNLETRSDIDSTRVHVDEELLRDWFVETQHTSAVRYVQTVRAEGPTAKNESLISYLSRHKDDDMMMTGSSIGSDLILIQIVDQTLATFASDSRFGLDSYLSRRIRHGTLRGQLYTPVDRELKAREEAVLKAGYGLDQDDKAAVHNALQNFRGEFIDAIEDVRMNVIQIHSDVRPQGLIYARWRDAVNVRYLDAAVSRIRRRVIETDRHHDLFPDVLALCWDCLESDLLQLRRYMAREFPARILALTDRILSNCPTRERGPLRGIFRGVMEVVQSRCHEICGWFIRPVFRQDEYSLRTLVNTYFSTVRELDGSYRFSEQFDMAEDINIDRLAFEVLGDILLIVIGNAARHGKADGRIRVVAHQVPDRPSDVELGVSSETRDIDHFLESVARIKEALSMTDLEYLNQSAVSEGFTGLRKINLWFRSYHISRASIGFELDPDNGTIAFRIKIPSKLAVARSEMAS